MFPVFSAYWFNTGHMSTSVYGGFWWNFTYFLRQGGPRILVLCNAWFDSGYMLCVSFRYFLADVPVVLVVQVLMGCRRGGDSRAPTVAFVEKFFERGSSSTR